MTTPSHNHELSPDTIRMSAFAPDAAPAHEQEHAPLPLPLGIVPPPAHTALPHFGLIAIGDEILSGRRKDLHIPKTIDLLGERGLHLSYVHMVGDDRAAITMLLRQALHSGDVVFCCGGIGATPDDQTRQAAAQAQGVPLVLHPVAKDLIIERMREVAQQKGENFDPLRADNVQRLEMAVFPQGAQLVPNPYNKIAGFSLGHLHFMPGFPVMAWPMMEWLLDHYYARWHNHRNWSESSVVVLAAYEATLTPLMLRIEGAYPGVRVFSLPSVHHPEYGPHIELGVKGEAGLATEAFEDLLTELQRQDYRLGPVMRG